MYGLVSCAVQIAFYSAGIWIVLTLLYKIIFIKICSEYLVNAVQKMQVELFKKRMVVGGIKQFGVFHEVKPNQQIIFWPQRLV